MNTKQKVKAAVKRKNRPKEGWDDQLVLAAGIGALMGTVLDKSTLRKNVQSQFQMENINLLKFCVGATCAALMTHGLMQFVSKTRDRVIETMPTTFSKQGTVAVIVGSLFIGAGMALSNSSPTIAFAQAGAGLSVGYYTILGIFVASIAYGLFLQGPIEGALLPDIRKESPLINTFVGLNPPEVALALSAILFLGAQALEAAAPMSLPPSAADEDANIVIIYLSMTVWNPSVSGFLFGATQGLCIYVLDRTLAVSTAMLTLIATPTLIIPNKHPKSKQVRDLLKYFLPFRDGCMHWYQPLLLLGVYLGSSISASAGNTYGEGDEHLPDAFVSLVGGLAMGLGMRIAGGCPLGFSVSGVAHLELNSFIAVAFIVVGGMATASII